LQILDFGLRIDPKLANPKSAIIDPQFHSYNGMFIVCL